jgi:hypothetical protein
MDANQCVTSRGYPGPLLSISPYHYQAKGNWIIGLHCLLFKLVAVLAGHLCEFHTEQWGEPCSVPVGCLPHAFLQLIVCKSAVNCLKSLSKAVLSQDWQWEGAFACPHTLFLACTSLIWLLFWLGTHVNLIPNSEGSLALFLSPHVSAIDSLQECSRLFEEVKGSTAFKRLAVGRCLCMHPYFVSCLYFSNLVAVLAGHLCEFHIEQWGEPCFVPVSCLPHTFLQSTVCRSVDCQVFEELKGGAAFAG